jgi:hypothetical protein
MLGYDDTQSPSSDIFTGMVKPGAWALRFRYTYGNDGTRSESAPRPIDFGNGDIRSLGAPLPTGLGEDMMTPGAWALRIRYIYGNDGTRSESAPRPTDFGNGDIRSLGAPLPIASGMIVSVCVRACVDYVGALTG